MNTPIIVDAKGMARFFTVRDALNMHLREMSVTLPAPLNISRRPLFTSAAR